MRKVIIAGNWKMNKTLAEGQNFIEELKTKKVESNAVKMIFAPTIMLEKLVELTKGTDITIGAQNMHQEEFGAYTGETSAEMLKSIGIKTVLIGHSERRQFFNETDKIVNQKLLLAIKHELSPVVCVGETLDEREANITNSVLKTQITKAFENVEQENVANIVVAYEPVWAIGTGLTASADDANKACAYIRELLTELYSKETAEQVIIQYGGSVSPANISELLEQSDIDGGLVGGASLDVESYTNLLV